MELLNNFANVKVIGNTKGDCNYLILRSAVFNCYYVKVTKYLTRYERLKDIVNEYPETVLYKLELTPEELHSIEPQPTIIMDISPQYKIVAYNNQYNIFKKYGEYVRTNYFVHPCNKSIDENMAYNSYNTITEAIKMLTRFGKTKITCFGSNLNVDEWNEVTKNFNIHIK